MTGALAFLSIEGKLTGPENMARDAQLLSEAAGGRLGCRIYGWEGPWVSLGRFQDPSRALLDPEAVAWVMRPTGGKAVLHGHDVTVAIGMPLLRGPRMVRDGYRLLAGALVGALRRCGIPAAIAEDTRFVALSGSADCFAGASPNDIVHERLGVKVCGCALRFTKSAALMQASIPAGAPLIDPMRIFAEPSSLPVLPWDTALLPEALAREADMLAAMRQ